MTITALERNVKEMTIILPEKFQIDSFLQNVDNFNIPENKVISDKEEQKEGDKFQRVALESGILKI